jgi:hypothetical protein
LFSGSDAKEEPYCSLGEKLKIFVFESLVQERPRGLGKIMAKLVV